MQPVVEVIHLKKRYGDLTAVDDVHFSVAPGRVFGLVGPNGAGKTTTVECIEGLRTPDGGEVRVLGRDPRRHRKEIYRRIGVQLQESSMYENIRLGEALKLFGSMFKSSIAPEVLLREFDLEDRGRSFYGKMSGGQKRKFLTALALVGRPELVILDEPTSGLDPQSRISFWATLRRYGKEGLSVLLTTHDLAEAEENCDEVCIVDRGRVVALGPPGEMVRQHNLGTRIAASIPAGGLDRAALQQIAGIRRVDEMEGRVAVFGDGEDFLPSITRFLRQAGADDATSRRANLEDLYLTITGRNYRREGEAAS